MLKKDSERKRVRCSWIRTRTHTLERPDDPLLKNDILKFTQAVCHLDGANCIPGRFAERNDCPDQLGRRRVIVIARKGQLRQEMGQAITVITE